LGTNGSRICKRLRQEFPEKYIIHIRATAVDRTDHHADVMLNPPLSLRSLLNTIHDLVSQKDSKILRCGSFQLDVDRRVLIVAEQETPLSPKQAALIEIFLCHPNQILEREWLIKQVWRTNYTEDTRTLNVHIRYVREIMEVDPGNPQYIKTVRGKGYRFEVQVPQNKKADT
jgi:DNA-binding response OmpR family regulator